MDNDWLWALRVTQMNRKTLESFAWKILKNRIQKQTDANVEEGKE